MTIRYLNGDAFEAVLLSRTDRTMRVALRGADDIVELKEVHGSWITDQCEPVQVTFAWQGKAPVEVPAESDCICPPELAARLIDMLHAGENEAGADSVAPVKTRSAASVAPVV